MMTLYRYYVLLVDETGGEFGIYIHAHDMDSCLDMVSDKYPECGVVDARKS